jgi:hypothetical protein
MARSSGSGPVSSAKEQCLGCGEETALGSVFYSDRTTIEQANGERAYLCSLCDSRIRSSRRGRPMTDEEARQLVTNGIGVLYGTNGRL